MATLRRHQQDAPAPMCFCAAAVLLRGWSQEQPPVDCADDSHTTFFDLFDPRDMARLWREHEFYLRGVAQQWGWRPTVPVPDGRVLFYGEAANVLGCEP